MNPSKVSIGGGNFPSSHGDSRDDLGYARLNPKYHVPKMLGNNSYPYRDEDEDLEDVEIGLDPETIDTILGMIEPPQDYDPGGGHYDPFSFAGGNTSLAGPSHIGETFSPSPSMVPPIAQKIKRSDRSVASGTRAGTARGDGSTMGHHFDTGDRWGWSNPILQDLFDQEQNEDHNYTLEDIANSDDPLRECIRLLIMELR